MTASRAAALAVTVLIALYAPSVASTYSAALANAAAALDHAAKIGAGVPDVHVPPAPLGGPPRYSPSVDDWLQAELNAARGEHSVKRRAAALRSVAAALRYLADPAALRSSLTQPRSDIAATTARILADPAYREAPTKAAPPPEETIWQKILRWFFDQLGKLFDGLARATQAVPFLGDVFAIVLIGVAVLALVYVGYRVADGFLVRRRRATVDIGDELPVSATAEQLHQAAREAARIGNYARAVALLFQASLIVLDRTDRVAYDPALTAGEYRRLVRRRAQSIAADFDSLARIFTAAAYAQGPVNERDWSQASSAFAVLGQPLGAG